MKPMKRKPLKKGTIGELRAAIKARYPNLKFTVRTVHFTDLMRGSKVFVESHEWGMAVGNVKLYHDVKAIADRFGALTHW
jgi:hypothetical protein